MNGNADSFLHIKSVKCKKTYSFSHEPTTREVRLPFGVKSEWWDGIRLSSVYLRLGREWMRLLPETLSLNRKIVVTHHLPHINQHIGVIVMYLSLKSPVAETILVIPAEQQMS
jgi:hypothetical protein